MKHELIVNTRAIRSWNEVDPILFLITTEICLTTAWAMIYCCWSMHLIYTFLNYFTTLKWLIISISFLLLVSECCCWYQSYYSTNLGASKSINSASSFSKCHHCLGIVSEPTETSSYYPILKCILTTFANGTLSKQICSMIYMLPRSHI